LFPLHKISVSFLLLFLFIGATAANPFRVAVGAREAGMGYSCIMTYDFWSSFNNQAGLALNKGLKAGINYENRFGIKELGTKTAGVIIPAGNSSLGIVYSNYGYSDLKKHFAGAACGLKFSEKIAAGVQIDYISERTSGEYGNNSFLTCEAGILIQPDPNTRLGLHVFNPVPNSLRKYFMPTELRIGAGYKISNVVFGGIEIEKCTGSNLIFKTGFEYEPVNRLFFRGGFSSNKGTLSFGIGYKTKIISTDIAFVTHERLGITPSISIIIKP
jgi:hypothetical protein